MPTFAKHLLSGAITLTASACLLSACMEAPASSTHPKNDRPRGLSIPISAAEAAAAGAVTDVRAIKQVRALAGPGAPPLPIFLNRNGGTYSPGSDNSRNNTSIVPDAVSTIGEYPYGDASWQAVVQCLSTMFQPYNVALTETEPSSGEYVEAVIAGHPNDVGLPNGVGGVAPIDSFSCNIIPRAIVFAFADVYGNDPQAICETAAQEIAHAFSLDHAFLCPDPMTYLGGCGDKTFRDVDAQCGEFEPRACNCGRPSQNSIEVLTEKLGAATPSTPVDDPTPPEVAISAPANSAVLAPNSDITITANISDDVGLVASELVWDFTDEVFACPFSGAGGAVTCTVTGNVRTWRLSVGQGTRVFSVRARDVGGNVNETAKRSITLGIVDGGVDGGTTDVTPPTVSITEPLDGAQLLANSDFTITANITDDVGVAQAELVVGATAFPCPLTSASVNCSINGNTYAWRLQFDVGERTFLVQARDLAGHLTASAPRTITLVGGTPPVGGDSDGAEDNDTADTAFALRCGSTLELIAAASDEDWFAIDTPAQTAVDVTVTTGAPLQVAVLDVAQNTLAVSDDARTASTLQATLNTAGALVHVAPAASTAGYRLTVTCRDGNAPLSPGDDDNFEPNDTIANATPATCDSTLSGLVAANDDLFAITLDQSSTLVADVVGDVAASILTASGEVLVEGSAHAATSTLAAGTYFVRTRRLAADARYDVAFACPPPTFVAVNRADCSASGPLLMWASPVLALLLRRVRRQHR